MRGISWLAANQLAAHEGLCTMEWVSKLEKSHILCSFFQSLYTTSDAMIVTAVSLCKFHSIPPLHGILTSLPLTHFLPEYWTVSDQLNKSNVTIKFISNPCYSVQLFPATIKKFQISFNPNFHDLFSNFTIWSQVPFDIAYNGFLRHCPS